MIKSMTGFGRVQETVDGMNVTVELRSVNHRYFEFTAKVPRTYGFLEEKLKTFTNSLVSRGKVECYVAVEQLEESETTVSVNASLAKGYVDALRQLSEMFDLSADVSAAALSRYPDVLVRKAESGHSFPRRYDFRACGVCGNTFAANCERI